MSIALVALKPNILEIRNVISGKIYNLFMIISPHSMMV